MQYFIFLSLLLLSLFISSSVYAQAIAVPSAHCLSSNPCTTTGPTSASISVTGPASTPSSGTPPPSTTTAPSTAITDPSPSTAPCSTSGSSVSSQSTGSSVSAMSRHHYGKWHRSGRRGFLQQLIQWLLQLLLKLGMQLPGLPCGTTSSPSGIPSTAPSSIPSSGAGNGGNSPSSVPASPTIATATQAPTTSPTTASTGTPPAQCESDNNGYTGAYGGYTFNPSTTTPNSISLSSQWNVVDATCPSQADGFSPWVGIETNDLLVQGGSVDQCPSPTSYFGIFEAYPQPSVPFSQTTYPVDPGDTIYSSVTMNTPGKFTTVVKNITKGWTYTVNTTDTAYTSLLTDNEPGQISVEDLNGVQNPLASFTTPMTFTNSQYSINGSSLAPLAKAPGLACTDIARGTVGATTILDLVSPITGGNFTETWKQQ